MARFVMVIDLRKCIGCGTCQQICEDIHRFPPGANWRKVYEETNKDGNGRRLFIPKSCMHCEKPPCLEVCPTKATKQRPDGIVEIDNDRCMGCGACIVACPYEARSIADYEILSSDTTNDKEIFDGCHDHIGVCTKCNFCAERLDKGIAQGLQPGDDPDATPMCVRYCIAEALYFGDADDPKSVISKLIFENKVIRLGEDIGTNPSVYYIVGSTPEENR